MKLFDKIREKMCMSKTSAVIGFRVTLRLVSLYLQINHRLSSWRLLKQTHRSDPTLRKGICCSSLEDLRKKIANKFPHHEHTLPLFTDDGTEVKEALRTFQRIRKTVTHIQVDDDDYLMSLAPQSLLVVGKAPVTSPTPENIFDRLLTLLRESSGASSVYNEVTPWSLIIDQPPQWMDGIAPNSTEREFFYRCLISWQRTSSRSGTRCTAA